MSTLTLRSHSRDRNSFNNSKLSLEWVVKKTRSSCRCFKMAWRPSQLMQTVAYSSISSQSSATQLKTLSLSTLSKPSIMSMTETCSRKDLNWISNRFSSRMSIRLRHRPNLSKSFRAAVRRNSQPRSNSKHLSFRISKIRRISKARSNNPTLQWTPRTLKMQTLVKSVRVVCRKLICLCLNT